MTNEQLDGGDVVERLRGRARFLYDRGEIKSPGLMMEADDAITALRARAEAAEADAERLAEALAQIAARPDTMIWGEDGEIRDAMTEMYGIAATALAAHNERMKG